MVGRAGYAKSNVYFRADGFAACADHRVLTAAPPGIQRRSGAAGGPANGFRQRPEFVPVFLTSKAVASAEDQVRAIDAPRGALYGLPSRHPEAAVVSGVFCRVFLFCQRIQIDGPAGRIADQCIEPLLRRIRKYARFDGGDGRRFGICIGHEYLRGRPSSKGRDNKRDLPFFVFCKIYAVGCDTCFKPRPQRRSHFTSQRRGSNEHQLGLFFSDQLFHKGKGYVVGPVGLQYHVFRFVFAEDVRSFR